MRALYAEHAQSPRRLHENQSRHQNKNTKHVLHLDNVGTIKHVAEDSVARDRIWPVRTRLGHPSRYQRASANLPWNTPEKDLLTSSRQQLGAWFGANRERLQKVLP